MMVFINKNISMELRGSCHCQAVTFTCVSHYPYPFNVCYCSVCRKTAGAGGSVINLHAEYDTLKVTGEDNISIYQMKLPNGDLSPAKRHFCKLCSSCLWLYDPRWSTQFHPFASAIDTDLPSPPEHVHLMLNYKANWVIPAVGPNDRQFAEYPEESIADWHQRLNIRIP